LFATFGGWLVLLLTALFWEWSGMASLGFLYLVLVAPVGTAALAWSLYRRRAMSGFHRSAFVASISYSGLVLATLLGWLVARLLAS
jgi:heme O synthase-like polyprenyltransferase